MISYSAKNIRKNILKKVNSIHKMSLRIFLKITSESIMENESIKYAFIKECAYTTKERNIAHILLTRIMLLR